MLLSSFEGLGFQAAIDLTRRANGLRPGAGAQPLEGPVVSVSITELAPHTAMDVPGVEFLTLHVPLETIHGQKGLGLKGLWSSGSVGKPQRQREKKRLSNVDDVDDVDDVDILSTSSASTVPSRLLSFKRAAAQGKSQGQSSHLVQESFEVGRNTLMPIGMLLQSGTENPMH